MFHTADRKKGLKIHQILCKKKEQERTEISRGASVTSPAAHKALLAACTILATRQTKYVGNSSSLILLFIDICLKQKKHKCFLPSFLLPTHKFLPLHCASPEPQPVQYFVRDYNCFRGLKPKGPEI